MIWSYEAYNNHGEKIFGTLEAENKEEVATYLYEQKMIVSEIRPVKNVSRSKVKPEQLIIFTRLLATGINASIPLTKALEITMAELPAKSNLGMIIVSILHQLKVGKSLSDALRLYQNVFSELYINMVRAGEKSGKLGQALNEVLKYLQKRYEMGKNVSSALLYPALILAFTLLILTFFVTVLIPHFQESYKSFGGNLPEFTLGLLNTTNWIKSHLILIVVITILTILSISRLIKTPKGRKAYENFIFSIPIVGELVRKDIVARFARTLSVLLTNGITLVESLELLQDIVGNSIFEETLYNAVHDLREGKSFSGALKENKHIPSILIQMTTMGEESGRLAQLMENMADFYEKEVDTSIEKITSVITPIMIMFIGLIVGVIVVALYLPIFNISKIMGNQ